jgi:hypothetical protein
VKLAPFRVVKRQTDDGLVSFEDDVPLGRVYLIDIDSISVATMTHVSGVAHQKRIGYAANGRWLPMDCLELVVSRGKN